MRKNLFRYACIILFSYLLYFDNEVVLAQQTLPDQALLRDIEIMETILDRLITPEQGHFYFFGSKNTQGYYLANYGVIFNVNYSLFNRTRLSFDIDKRLRLGENNLIYIDTDENHKEVLNEFGKELDQLKESIARFLGTWTSALTELKPDEKITVIVDFNSFFSNFTSQYNVNLRQLIASVPISDIKEHRKDGIKDKEFIKRINFNEVKSSDEDISILSNIIETSLAHENSKNELGLSGHVKGIHFKGYGAIFFTEISSSANFYTKAWSVYTDAAKKGRRQSLTIKNIPDEPKDTIKDIEKVEQKLINLISNYGHNLRNLQPDEWVEIAIDFKGVPVKDNYSRSVLKVQKKIIDDYNRDNIKFDDFKKRVNIIYY